MRKIIVFLLLTLSAFAFTGKVVKVADGDTITVLVDNKMIKVRLDGIDCPEKGQPWGKAARNFTCIFAFNEIVTVEEQGTDKYGRTLGIVILSDKTNLNQELLSAGLAWWYWKYSDDKYLGELEQEARENQQGLWRDSNPVPPWEWRKGH